ncbi:NKAP family protein CG6066-like [Physella acuta]|uniref:NKAP family protein CG6066-like n=1 Tax=Physella acuta TaxID=109671 RepID=UPI0027DBD87F|nr:NKAP family protein CG6066-like [Physella acuta]
MKKRPRRVERVWQSPVSSRTRLRTRGPTPRIRPVQYPQQWLGRRRSPEDRAVKTFRPNRNMLAPTVRAKEMNAENESDGMSPQQKIARWCPSRADLNSKIFQQALSKKARIKEATTSKRLKSSLIELVKFKPIRRKSPEKGSKRRRKKSQKSRPRKRASLRKGVKKRVYRRRRSLRTRVRRRRNAQRRRIIRRRRKTTRKTRRRRRRNESEESDQQRREVIHGPADGHAQDQNLTEQKKITVGNLDEGHDEVKEDPLNVYTLWRTLVKGMPGVPADSRDVTTNDKDDKPELQRDKKEKPVKKRVTQKGKRRVYKNTSNNRRRQKKNRKRGRKIIRRPKPRTSRRKKYVNINIRNKEVKKLARKSRCALNDDEPAPNDEPEDNDPDISNTRRSSRHVNLQTDSPPASPKPVARPKKSNTTSRHVAMYRAKRKRQPARRKKTRAKPRARARTSARTSRRTYTRTSHRASHRTSHRTGSRTTTQSNIPKKNNVNNNQQEITRWHRVGGRLMRVKDYICSRIRFPKWLKTEPPPE